MTNRISPAANFRPRILLLSAATASKLISEFGSTWKQGLVFGGWGVGGEDGGRSGVGGPGIGELFVFVVLFQTLMTMS